MARALAATILALLAVTAVVDASNTRSLLGNCGRVEGKECCKGRKCWNRNLTCSGPGKGTCIDPRKTPPPSPATPAPGPSPTPTPPVTPPPTTTPPVTPPPTTTPPVTPPPTTTPPVTPPPTTTPPVTPPPTTTPPVIPPIGIPPVTTPGLPGGPLATATSSGQGGSISGSGVSSTFGGANTFASKNPLLAVGSAQLGTSVVGGSGLTVGSVSSGTGAQVSAPGLLNTATGSSTAGFAGQGSVVNGVATTSDRSVAAPGFAANSIRSSATGVSSGGLVGTAVGFKSFAQDP